jgi:hypothetical protein
MWAPSLMRGWVYSLQLLLGLASVFSLWSESRRTYDHILLYQIWDSPNMEGQVPVFISLRNRVAQLHPWALGFLFITSYDSGPCITGQQKAGDKQSLCSAVKSSWNAPTICRNILFPFSGFMGKPNKKLSKSRSQAELMTNTVFWAVMICSLMEAQWCFRGMYGYHPQGWRES